MRAGQELTGVVHLTANERSVSLWWSPLPTLHDPVSLLFFNPRQSYNVEIDLSITGTNIHIMSSHDLKNPNFRYMSVPPVPPGSYHTNPTEVYWDSQSQPQATTPVNPQNPTPQPLSPMAHQTINQSIMHYSQMPVLNGGLLSPPGGHTPHVLSTHPIMDRRTQAYQVHTTVHGLANAAGMINIGGSSSHHMGPMGSRSNQILLGSGQPLPSSNQFVYPSHGGHNPHSIIMQKPTHS